MAYQEIFQTDLEVIVSELQRGTNQTAAFKTHLDQVVNLGSYDQIQWNEKWVKAAYAFGESFSNIDPNPYVTIIENLRTVDKKKNEILDFYLSEISVHADDIEDSIEFLEKLTKTYPNNPEIHNSYGILLKKNGETTNSIRPFRRAFKLNDTKFNEALYNCYLVRFDELIEQRDFNLALSTISTLLERETFKSWPHLHNHLITVCKRIEDHISFDSRMKDAENEIHRKIENETKLSQKRLIEIVGVFSAILAFIFSTITISKTFSFEESIVHICCLGLILTFFSTTLSLYFGKKVESILDNRILVFTVLLFTILIVITQLAFPLILN